MKRLFTALACTLCFVLPGCSGSNWYDYTLSDIEGMEWTFRYPVLTRPAVGDFAEVQRVYEVKPADRYILRLTGGDNYNGPTSGYRIKQLLVDGEVVWEQDVAGGAKGMQPIEADVTKHVKGKPSVAVIMRVIARKRGGNFGVDVWWGQMETEGLWPVKGSAWKRNTQGQWRCLDKEECRTELKNNVSMLSLSREARRAEAERNGFIKGK